MLYGLTACILIILCGSSLAQPVSSAARGRSSAAGSVIYTNTQFGFHFSLPKTWKGYSIITYEWEGGTGANATGTKGPIIVIRHPRWTEAEPREDIPIMVFTHPEWNLIARDQGELIVSAAPFPPSELGRNAKFVFALPPRYNSDLSTGWEEVAQIMTGKPLHAF
jgi:hypothetical protein